MALCMIQLIDDYTHKDDPPVRTTKKVLADFAQKMMESPNFVDDGQYNGLLDYCGLLNYQYR